MKLSEWGEEVKYCSELVETMGNYSVPKEAVLEYLKLQEKSAENEGFTDHSQALADLIDALRIPRPDPNTMCHGPCDGVGLYPQNLYDPDITVLEYQAWQVAHAASHKLNPWTRIRGAIRLKRWWWLLDFNYLFVLSKCDGWHFIPCSVCKGTGLGQSPPSMHETFYGLRDD